MSRIHSSLRGRDASSGRFITLEEARAHPSTTVVARVANAGFHVDSSTERGRDARTGHFISIAEAHRRPTTTTVERVPNPGNGVG